MGTDPIFLVFVFLVLLGAALAGPAAALDVCPDAGHFKQPPKPAGGSAPDPCENLRYLAKVTAACAAEYPEDRGLQTHAAGILELERKRRIDTQVIAGLRRIQAEPRSSGMKNDPELLAKRIAMAEEALARLEADLDARRKRAAGAGYAQLAHEGVPQKIVTNAVWRYLDGEIRRHDASCATEAGREAARNFAGMLAVSFSHGNPIEREIMRRLLQPAGPAR